MYIFMMHIVSRGKEGGGLLRSRDEFVLLEVKAGIKETGHAQSTYPVQEQGGGRLYMQLGIALTLIILNFHQ